MKSIILAGAIALAFTLFATPGFIWLFKRVGWGQFIRDDGPKSHHTKRGTPTMGGIAIILGAVLGVFGGKLFNGEPISNSALLVLFMMVGLGLVGFIDDFIKTHRQRSLGLSGWAKIFGQGVVAVAFAIMALQLKDADGWSPASASISVVRDTNIDLMFWGPVVGLILFVVWIYFLVAATSNGVNIADGLDGLATGSTAMSIGAYAIIGFWQFNQSCFRDPLIQNCYEVKDSLDLAVVAADLFQNQGRLSLQRLDRIQQARAPGHPAPQYRTHQHQQKHRDDSEDGSVGPQWQAEQPTRSRCRKRTAAEHEQRHVTGQRLGRGQAESGDQPDQGRGHSSTLRAGRRRVRCR